MADIWENNGNSDKLYFLGLQNQCGQVTADMKLKDATTWKKSYVKPREYIKK